MNQNQVRIGIDVGGTFTDAVVIDNQTLEIIAKKKIPTTHDSPQGVAQGIIDVIQSLLEENEISVKNVSFISHGTTQATNALLEGDVAKIGIIGMGDGASAKNETNVPEIELAPNRKLHIFHEFIPSNLVNDSEIGKAIDRLLERGAEVIVASESFSIENPDNELKVMKIAQERGLYASGGHEISQLFGLKLRSRTAAINGSLIPKMMETSLMTEEVVKALGIEKDLMIMRADGGVMNIQEVKKRPILTMLSGLAAGIAGAIMYEKISEGIFMEIGGTSADISVIKDGKVMVKNASVGGHKTYLKSVDVRTTAIAGGTMIRADENMKLMVGPRSSHLANLNYDCFGDIDINSLQIEKIQPILGDSSDYLIIKDKDNKKLAFTLAGAANHLKIIPKNDYSYQMNKINDHIWEFFGTYMKMDSQELAKKVLGMASDQIWKIIEELKDDYELDQNYITLYGGGGSAGVLTHFMGKRFKVKSEVVQNAPYISTIGVALAMITETIERSVINPDEEDIKKIRFDILDKMLEMGALKETVEISIEVDAMNHVLIATATGANEINPSQGKKVDMSDEELFELAKVSVGVENGEASIIALNEGIKILQVKEIKKGFLSKLKKNNEHIVVVSHDGIVKYRRKNAEAVYGQVKNIEALISHLSDNLSSFSDAGQTIPEVIMFCKYRTFDYSGLMHIEQIKELVSIDLEGVDEDERVIFIATRRG